MFASFERATQDYRILTLGMKITLKVSDWMNHILQINICQRCNYFRSSHYSKIKLVNRIHLLQSATEMWVSFSSYLSFNILPNWWNDSLETSTIQSNHCTQNRGKRFLILVNRTRGKKYPLTQENNVKTGMDHKALLLCAIKRNVLRWRIIHPLEKQ